MDLVLHPGTSDDRPDPERRLSTVGHAEALRAFARVARDMKVEFLLIGGAYRDVAVRASSTRDIDVVLIDRDDLDEEAMRRAGFKRDTRSRHAWRYATADGRVVDLEIAAVASSKEAGGPFSVAFRNSLVATIEGIDVRVPTIQDYVVLKLIAAASDRRRRARDLLDVQYAAEAHPTDVSVAAVRARLREAYGVTGERSKELVRMLRDAARIVTGPR